METRLSSRTKEVIISSEGPTILIGERINPTGKKKLQAALLEGNLDLVKKEAIDQVAAGADILDVNVGATGVDEVSLLPQAILAVMEVVDVPLCIDSSNPRAIEAALAVYEGRPLVNSVTADEASLSDVLALIKAHDAAVIGVAQDIDHTSDATGGQDIKSFAVEVGPQDADIGGDGAAFLGSDVQAHGIFIEQASVRHQGHNFGICRAGGTGRGGWLERRCAGGRLLWRGTTA